MHGLLCQCHPQRCAAAAIHRRLRVHTRLVLPGGEKLDIPLARLDQRSDRSNSRNGKCGPAAQVPVPLVPPGLASSGKTCSLTR
eukprot:COSAG06_NODE_7_length_38054_cov_37.302569_31_plen_84_part_00